MAGWLLRSVGADLGSTVRLVPMPIHMFFNEWSLPTGRPARAVCVEYLKSLVAALRAARGIDQELMLHSEHPIASLPLGEIESVASIRNDSDCVEESLFLKALQNRAPFDASALPAEKEDPNYCEYKLELTAPVHPSKVAVGLGMAHIFGGIGLSFASHSFWGRRQIPLDRQALDRCGEISETKVCVLNIDSLAAVNDHDEALRRGLAPNFADGDELRRRRAELLPNLLFIPRTQDQLQGVRNGDPMLEQVWIKLSGIDRAIEAWKVTGGPYPMFPFNVRPESRSRQALANFRDSTGELKIFSQHCDLAPSEWRLHFILETEPMPHAVIGHIGRKLGIG